ncbi:hypothetical protein BJY24_004565 [Nocardia transvalensis]|uniref:Uncharacterized protein n=1 Tax=Nocardia transvalensis TaxID=37333 RepID=A0A7W9PHJ1_9NOCA|nr:hypothetical protein [Nocardia transvalensis]MBB5915653.1 hypothetical protein [Nocardia transvalensis]
MSGWQLPALEAQRASTEPERMSESGPARSIRMVVDADNWLRPVIVYDEAAILRMYADALE